MASISNLNKYNTKQLNEARAATTATTNYPQNTTFANPATAEAVRTMSLALNEAAGLIVQQAAEIASLSAAPATTGTAQAVTTPAINEGATSDPIEMDWAGRVSFLQELEMHFFDGADDPLEVTDFNIAIYDSLANATAGTFQETDAGQLVLIVGAAGLLLNTDWYFRAAALGYLAAAAATPTKVWAKFSPVATSGNVPAKAQIILKGYEFKNATPAV